MRVRVSQQEKRTWFLGKIRQVAVFVQVEFSREELAIIAARRLKDYVVLERVPDSRTAAAFALGRHVTGWVLGLGRRSLRWK